jgi:hypothetical protein
MDLLSALGSIHTDSEAEFVEIIGLEQIEHFKAALKNVAGVQRRIEMSREDSSELPPPNGARRKRGRPRKQVVASES